MKKILLITICSLFLITGCYSDKEETPEPVEEIVEGLLSSVEYGHNDDATATKIKLNISNNTKEEYELNKVKILVTDIEDKVTVLEKEVNYIVKIGEIYIVEMESEIEYEKIKSVSYNI